jgi:hypothetical protein
MNREEKIELDNLTVIEDRVTYSKNHERSDKILSNCKVKHVDVKSFLNKLGWFIDQDNQINHKRSALIILIQVLTLLIPWTYIFKSAFLLFINDKSEWNYLLGDLTPALGEKIIYEYNFFL